MPEAVVAAPPAPPGAPPAPPAASALAPAATAAPEAAKPAGPARDASGKFQPVAPAATTAAEPDKTILGAKTAPTDYLPEKYRVSKDDGTLDVDASARKLAEGHKALETRLGTGDARPNTPAEYKLNVPEQFKQFAETLDPAKVSEFQAEVHKAGLSQAQYDFLMAKYFEQMPQLAAGMRQLDHQTAVAELKKAWATDQEYQKGVAHSDRALRAYAGPDADSIARDYGNDPRLIRLLAKVGGELKEDTAPNPRGSVSPDAIQTLINSPAYIDAKHPDHTRVSEQIRRHFESLPGGTTPIV